MSFTGKSLFLVFAFALAACVPDTTDRADFYSLCSRHVENYMSPGERVVEFETAQKNIDFVYWKAKDKARITTFVRSTEPNTGNGADLYTRVRSCSFKVAGNGWQVE